MIARMKTRMQLARAPRPFQRASLARCIRARGVYMHRARYTHANTWPRATDTAVRAMQRMHGRRAGRSLSYAHTHTHIRIRARMNTRAREKETEIEEKTAGKGGCSTRGEGYVGGREGRGNTRCLRSNI